MGEGEQLHQLQILDSTRPDSNHVESVELLSRCPASSAARAGGPLTKSKCFSLSLPS